MKLLLPFWCQLSTCHSEVRDVKEKPVDNLGGCENLWVPLKIKGILATSDALEPTLSQRLRNGFDFFLVQLKPEPPC